MPDADIAARLPAPPPLSDDCALFLDVDGCLLDFHDDPASVRAEPPLVARLDAIARRLDGALALVSGRSIASLDRMFAPGAFAAGGLHGLERRAAGSMPAPEAAVPAFDRAAWTKLVADARAWMAGHPRAVVEDKQRTLALHWRAAPEAEGDARAFAALALARLPGYQLQPGNRVLELRPAGADKGGAIAAFLSEPPFAGRTPVFAGDDLTDEPGFALVNERAGISIVVGDRRPTQAAYRLADPAGVRRWLEQWPGDGREASA
ncbi:trehalose-phosphatase [Thermomonas brevis]|uniref:Trehalose 6-phosphate phosphatase n=1 Tax=Thermomonas brevis TaxID=215691 RepID=A0A7G9QS63_9GAMM|nr:trehalose-phosphatase [Thermomonas brevis]QNN46188.1 trehalose-phosphatase [Thermomonas brevis]